MRHPIRLLTILSATVLVLLFNGSAFGTTKACKIAMDAAGDTQPRLQSLVDELDQFTDASRPTVERALTAYIDQFKHELTATCRETGEKEALAVLDKEHERSSIALVNYANARRDAARK